MFHLFEGDIALWSLILFVETVNLLRDFTQFTVILSGNVYEPLFQFNQLNLECGIQLLCNQLKINLFYVVGKIGRGHET